jgi:SAM-dependent methyltransferase
MAAKRRAFTGLIRLTHCCDERSGNARPGRYWWKHPPRSFPFDTSTFDTVVTTWTLCTIPQVIVALCEMRRVLRPDGRLLFVEHGLAPDHTVARWQHGLTPCWKCLGGGCHLNRKIDDLITAAGFRIERLETGYMRGRNPFTFMYEGLARSAA